MDYEERIEAIYTAYEKLKGDADRDDYVRARATSKQIVFLGALETLIEDHELIVKDLHLPHNSLFDLKGGDDKT